MSDLPEIIVTEENVESPDQDKIIMNIFTICDTEKTGSVRVSKLIEFMSPYVDFDSAHLEELRRYLDPQCEDPSVISSVFFKSMKEWTDKFKNEFNCTPTEIVDTNCKRLSDIALRQSTPTKNYAKGFFKGEYESGILNLSNISTYSCHTGAVAVPVDVNALQEQINDLEYQNKKLNDVISDVKQQLHGSEEQNCALQSDLDRITKRLQAEQKVNEHLQNERKVIEEYRESASIMLKKYESVNDSLSLCKKENSQLRNQITDSNNEIKNLQETLTKLRNSEAKRNQVIEELKIEIEVRDKEILTLEECKRQLTQVCSEKDDGIRQLIDESQHLEYRANVLEKRLLEASSRNKVQPEKLSESVFPESKPSPSKRVSKSLSPNVSYEEDNYWDDVVPIVQPYESLQSELMQVPSVGCVGCCDHSIKLTQHEQEIENLQCDLKQHENCQAIIEKYESEFEGLKTTIQKYEANEKILQKMLDLVKSDMKNMNMQEKMLEDSKKCFKELEEKFMNAQVENGKQIAAFKLKEEELQKECESQKKEVADAKRGIDKFAEKIDICKMDLQRAMCDKLMYEAELKTANEECERWERKCLAMEENVEEMLKNMEEQDKEREELMKNMRVKEKERAELIASNKDLSEQMSLYKENFLVAQNQVSSLKEEHDKQKETFNGMQEQFTRLRVEYDKLSSTYEAEERKLKEMEEASEDGKLYKESYLSAQKELLNLKADHANLKQNLEAKSKQMETLERELTELKIINEQNEGKLRESNTEIENSLNKLQAEYESKIREINSEHEKKMNEFDWLIIEKSGLEESLEIYEKKYRGAKEKLAQAEKLRTCYNETLATLKEKENDVFRLEEDTEENLAHISELEESLAKAQVEWAKLEFELQGKICALETEISVAKEDLEKAKVDSEELSRTLRCRNCIDLEVQKKSAKTKLDPKRSTRVELLYRKIEKLDSQLDEEKSRTKTLALDLAKVASEKGKLEAKLTELNKQMKELTSQKELGQTKIKKLSHSVEALELKLQNYKITIAEVNSKVTDTTTDVARVEFKYNDLQGKSSKVTQAHTLLVTHIGVVRRRMNEQKQILGENTLHVVNVWRTMLENIAPASPILQQDSFGLVSTTADSTSGPLDEEIHNLEQQIKLTCTLLKALAKLRDQFQAPARTSTNSPAHLERTFNMEHSGETRNESPLHQVVKKKFGLKPATFVFRSNSLNTSSMSPDSPAAEMAGESSLKEHVSPRVELNNNDILAEDVKLRSTEGRGCENGGNRKSFASDLTDSGSTSDSGSSESNGIEVVAKRFVGPQERLSTGESKIENEVQVQEGLARQFRSMSEGAAVTYQLTADGDVTVFPNLRDNVLETLGLLPDGKPKERLNEEETEDKFNTLALAFTIDAVTVADRRERQRRQRDQAEDNMEMEIERLTLAIHRLNPLCVDAETTEMLTSLLSQLDVILQASNRISTSAEVFGSVQQEWRLTDSVSVMLSHLKSLHQQRDTARRQLQCTKRMLQESTSSAEPTNPVNRPRVPTSNGRVVSRRRASIATITRPVESPRGSPGAAGCAVVVDGVTAKRVPMRRTSTAVSGELSSRSWDSRVRPEWSPMDRAAVMVRSARPSRLELGLDLVKIKEGAAESSTSDSFEKLESDSEFRTPVANSEDDVLEIEVSFAEPTTLRGHIRKKLLDFGAQIEGFWNYLVEEGTVHEICCLGAIVCFALCTITMGNLLLEVEYARRGIAVRSIEWNEFATMLVENLRTYGERPK